MFENAEKECQDWSMIINMQDDNVVSIDQIKEFLKLNSDAAKFLAENKVERNLWIENVLNRFRYFSCRKKEKNNC